MDEQLYVDVGDVLKHDDTYYLVDEIISDFVENTRTYCLIQIYPLFSLSTSLNIFENELKNFKIVFKSSKDDDFTDAYFKYALKAIFDDIKNEVEEMSEQNRAAKKNNRFLKTQYDVVYYDKIPEIDECLDAINDLKLLHQMFGDEAYLQLIEVVEKRLKELVKRKK